MNEKVLNSKKTEVMRRVIGITSIVLAMLYFIALIASASELFSLFNGLLLISSLVLITVDMFAFYGKKQTKLFTISIILYASYLSISIVSAIISMSEVNELMGEITRYPEYAETANNLFFDGMFQMIKTILVLSLFIALIFIATGKIKSEALSLAIPIITVGVELISFIFIKSPFSIASYIGSLLLVSIFAMRFLFCPKDYIRLVHTEELDETEKKQENLSPEQLREKLSYLKEQHESGVLTKEEYDSLRKSVVSKM